jgi:hypothetical protein
MMAIVHVLAFPSRNFFASIATRAGKCRKFFQSIYMTKVKDQPAMHVQVSTVQVQKGMLYRSRQRAKLTGCVGVCEGCVCVCGATYANEPTGAVWW